MRAIAVSVAWSIVLGLINLGSKTAFEITVSLGLEALYLSYFITASLLLYRRLNGDVIEPTEQEFDAFKDLTTDQVKLIWVPWRLKGWIGIANNMFAVLYLVVAGFFCFWPTVRAVTPKEMNWTSVILGGVVILSATYYFLVAKKHYNGPVVEVKVDERK